MIWDFLKIFLGYTFIMLPFCTLCKEGEHKWKSGEWESEDSKSYIEYQYFKMPGDPVEISIVQFHLQNQLESKLRLVSSIFVLLKSWLTPPAICLEMNFATTSKS